MDKKDDGKRIIFHSLFGGAYGILNQASKVASDYLGANLLRKFAAACVAHTQILKTKYFTKQARGANRHPLLVLVERTGFEPVTPTLPVLCAPNCANAPFRRTQLFYHTLR